MPLRVYFFLVMNAAAGIAASTESAASAGNGNSKMRPTGEKRESVKSTRDC